MSNEKWFYDQVTWKYFKDTREHIDHVLDKVNTMLVSSRMSTGQAMAQIYAELGIMDYDEALREFSTCVLPSLDWKNEIDEIKK